MKVYEKIRAEIERRELTVTAAADTLKISRPAFSNVVHGHAGLSVGLALKLEKHFNMNARRLLIQQLDDEIDDARMHELP